MSKTTTTPAVLTPQQLQAAAIQRANAAIATLPEATPAMIQAVRFDTSPRKEKNPMGGNIGSKAGAIDQILVAFVGYKVAVATVKNMINGAWFDTPRGTEPGKYNACHVSEKTLGRDQNGGVVLHLGETQYASSPGWLACNPVWAEKAGITAPTKGKGKQQAASSKPFQAGKGNKPKAKPASLQAKEASLEPTGLDHAAGRAIVAATLTPDTK